MLKREIVRLRKKQTPMLLLADKDLMPITELSNTRLGLCIKYAFTYGARLSEIVLEREWMRRIRASNRCK